MAVHCRNLVVREMLNVSSEVEAAVTDFDLTPEELETLASFSGPNVPAHVDPLHYAKLLSLALVEQKEGGPELTASGQKRLAEENEE